MNTTVQHIVELLFQNLERSEEVQALFDEVMNNCQERFNDLTARGMSEDEAVEAVADSLNGMEEILASYPRQQAASGEEQSAHADMDFSPEEIDGIDVSVIADDISIEESDDDRVHVLFNRDMLPGIRVAAADRILTIRQDAKSENRRKNKGKFEFHFESEEGFSFSSLGEMISRLMKNIGSSLSESDEICIQIPQWRRLEKISVHTTSGDVEVSDCRAEWLDVDSTSGDIEMDLPQEESAECVSVKTTSGDISVTCFAEECCVQTMSGDVEVEGRVQKMALSSVSGDMDVRADLNRLQFKSISGDVDVVCDNSDVTEIVGSTTSGDMTLRIPEQVCLAQINIRSTSGDAHFSRGVVSDNGTLRVDLHSVSGDIDIR